MKPILSLLLLAALLQSCQKEEEKVINIWLVGDSTMKELRGLAGRKIT
ncbi:MAG: hypothetical protein R2824_02135 [Saprospiraceae bacterium]|nr:hypothetical protein [Lewinella sp.]